MLLSGLSLDIQGVGNYVDVDIPAKAWGHCKLNSKHSHYRARAQGLVDDQGATCIQTMHCRQTTLLHRCYVKHHARASGKAFRAANMHFELAPPLPPNMGPSGHPPQNGCF